MFESWKRGWAYLFGDDLVSYYAFFTVIFVEIAFIWGGILDINLTLYTILLIACILNVLITAFLKGSWICENVLLQRIVSITYVLIYITLLVVGCLNNVNITCVLFGVPLVFAGIFTILRGNDLFYLLQFIMIVVPILTFAYFLLKVEMFWGFKAIAFTVFTLLLPIWAEIEDSWATQNIFELAYEVNWW